MKNTLRWSRLAEIREESLRIGKERDELTVAPYTRKGDRRMIELDKRYWKLESEAMGLVFNKR